MGLRDSELPTVGDENGIQPANDFIRVIRVSQTTGAGAGAGGGPYRITLAKLFRRGFKSLFNGGAINNLPDLTPVGTQTVIDVAQAQVAINAIQAKLDATLDQLNRIKNQLKN